MGGDKRGSWKLNPAKQVGPTWEAHICPQAHLPAHVAATGTWKLRFSVKNFYLPSVAKYSRWHNVSSMYFESFESLSKITLSCERGKDSLRWADPRGHLPVGTQNTAFFVRVYLMYMKIFKGAKRGALGWAKRELCKNASKNTKSWVHVKSQKEIMGGFCEQRHDQGYLSAHICTYMQNADRKWKCFRFGVFADFGVYVYTYDVISQGWELI